jgi:hypothetical protein
VFSEFVIAISEPLVRSFVMNNTNLPENVIIGSPVDKDQVKPGLFPRNTLLILSIILSWLILLGIGIAIGLYLSTFLPSPQNSQNRIPINQIPTVSPIPSITSMPTEVPMSTPTSAQPTPTNVVNEVVLVSKLIANFEKFNAVKNTAGCLDFFTPPLSSVDKTKLSQIRSINLPYSIERWNFGANDDRYLLNKKGDNLYQVIMLETRNGVATTLIVEVVRIGDNFLIDRYYEAGSSSTNLKYEGFKL